MNSGVRIWTKKVVVIIQDKENVGKVKKMEMIMAYLWYNEETALTQAPGWSAISGVLKLTSFPILPIVQANLPNL